MSNEKHITLIIQYWDHWMYFPFRYYKVVQSWKPKIYCVFKILNYIQKNTVSGECTYFEPELPTRWKQTEGVERQRRKERGGVWKKALVLRTRHRRFSQWKAVSSELAGVHEEDLMICHITLQSRAADKLQRSSKDEQKLLWASPGPTAAHAEVRPHLHSYGCYFNSKWAGGWWLTLKCVHWVYIGVICSRSNVCSSEAAHNLTCLHLVQNNCTLLRHPAHLEYSLFGTAHRALKMTQWS